MNKKNLQVINFWGEEIYFDIKLSCFFVSFPFVNRKDQLLPPLFCI